MRQPAVAGQFYPLRSENLEKELKRCFEGLELQQRKVWGLFARTPGICIPGK
jgi:AmmeMemoRadiSam system protein B